MPKEESCYFQKEPAFYLKLAGIYLDQRKTSWALETLKKVSELNPSAPQVIQQIGEAYEKSRRG